MQWETTAQVIANAINNLPLARCSNKERTTTRTCLSELDLVTPNRVLLGRNNRRALAGDVIIDNNTTAMMEHHNKITQSCLRIIYLNAKRFIPKPKWSSGDEKVAVGDVVLFPKREGPTGKQIDHEWRIGLVKEIDVNDSTYRANIEYLNATNTKLRHTTTRSVRQLVIIHRVEELEPSTHEYQMALAIQKKYQANLSFTKSS